MADARLLFEGDDVRVTAVHAESATCVVTYSGGQSGTGWRPTLLEGTLARLGLAAVHFAPADDHWWQTPEMGPACEAALPALVAYPDRIAFGTSMGGYGALAFAGALNAARVLAVSPQTVITDRRVTMQPYSRAQVDRLGVLHDDVPGDLPAALVPQLLYDPLSRRDLEHADWLAARRPIVRLEASGMGHKVLSTLKAAGLSSGEFHGLLTGTLDPDGFQDLLRTLRAAT
jgi:hypothetical protein